MSRHKSATEIIVKQKLFEAKLYLKRKKTRNWCVTGT